MRTTHRIAKKHAAEMSARALSIPMVIAHARPSLYRLQFGTMRTYVYQTARRELRVGKRAARLATWKWAAAYRERVSAGRD